MKCNVTSVYTTLVSINDTVSKLQDMGETEALNLYLDELEYKLRLVLDPDFTIVEDEEFRRATNIRTYIREIERAESLGINGGMSYVLGALLDKLEEFLY